MLVPCPLPQCNAAFWDGVLEALQLKPSQLEEIGRLHSDYVSRVEEAQARRSEAVERLAEVRGGQGRGGAGRLAGLECTPAFAWFALRRIA